MDSHDLAQSKPSAPSRPREPVTCRVSVVVVDYHQGRETMRLVRQLRQSSASRDGSAEIVILENAARPNSRLPRVRRPGVQLRRFRRNQGFARAVNHGSDRAQGSWLLLLNPDVTLPAEFLDRVLQVLDTLDPQADVGIVGLGLSNTNGTHQHSTGPFPTLAGSLARLLLPRSQRKYHLHAPGHAGPVDWVTGCCLLVRRSCWEQLGGFDPIFFLYYEDVDLCRRASQAGWRVLHDPSIRVTHHRPLHSRAVQPHIRFITRHALLTYARRHWPAWQVQFLAGIIRLEGWARSVWSWLGGRSAEATIFRSLAALAGELAQGRADQAEQRLRQVVRIYEETRGADPVHGHHSQLPPR